MTVTAYWGDENYLYGSATRVTGPGEAYANMMWLFEVAWLGDFDFYGDNEASRMVEFYTRAGRDQFVNYDGNGLARYSPGRMVVRLTNDDDKYDPTIDSTVLYPYITPGKYCQLSVLEPYDFIVDENGNFIVDENGNFIVSGNERADIFAGTLFDLQAITEEQTREKYIDLIATDGWGWLRERYPIVEGSASVSSSDAIQSVLDAIQWPAHWGSDLIDDSRNLPYFWGGTEDARAVLGEITDAQAGYTFIGGNGKLYHRPRNNIQQISEIYDPTIVLSNPSYPDPWEGNYNLSRVITHPYVTGGPNYLWVVGSDVDGQDLTISAGAELDFEGDYSVITGGVPGTSSPIITGISPTPLWVVETASGLDVSTYIHLISFEDSGNHFRARIKNYYPGTVYIIQFYIQGNWVAPINTVAFNDDRSAGATKKIFVSDSPYLMENVEASAIATKYANRVIDPGPIPSVEVEQRPDVQYANIHDRIHLWMFNLNYYVRAIEHRSLTKNCQAVRTTIFTEPYG